MLKLKIIIALIIMLSTISSAKADSFKCGNTAVLVPRICKDYKANTAYMNAIEMLSCEENYSAATEYFKETVNLGCEEDSLWFWFAHSLVKSKKDNSTVRVIPMGSVNEEGVIHYSKAYALSWLGRHQEAVTEYRIVVAKVPSFYSAWHNLAVELATVKQYDESLNIFDKLFTLNQLRFLYNLKNLRNLPNSLAKYIAEYMKQDNADKELISNLEEKIAIGLNQ